MKLRMDGFWNTFLIILVATVIVNLLVQLILNSSFKIGNALPIGILMGAAVGALVKFKKLSF